MVEISPRPQVLRRTVVLALALVGGMSVAVAQPGSNSPNQFGDRQAGQWGDPAQGHFGNPAAGDFDKSQVREPPPGAQALGKVHSGKPAPDAPYISLPTPADAAALPPAAEPARKPVKAKKRSAKKKKTAQ